MRQVVVTFAPAHDPLLDKMALYLKRLNEARFFGEIVLRYQDGVIQLVETTEKINRERLDSMF